MRDFYPEDMILRNRVFDAWRAAAERFGFQAYDAPVVEQLELLKRKAGEEIVQQLYVFADKSGRELALRAEMTPTLARMVAARLGQLPLPLKWYTVAQCFRYERTTRGRKREHYQWNLDIIGEKRMTAEAEVLATAVHALEAVGLSRTDFTVAFSSRLLLSELLESVGIEDAHHQATYLALDKRGKVSDEDICSLLEEEGLGKDQVDAVFSLMTIQTVDDAAERLSPDSVALADVRSFEALLADYGLAATVVFDIGVVRGLAYYTGLVFEAYDRERKFRAIFGGGRYDNLLGDVGGRSETGVGLGFGDVVVSEILAARGVEDAGDLAQRTTVGYMTDAERSTATALACRLRAEGRMTDLALKPEKPRAFFSRADKQGFAHAVYIGPDDTAAGAAKLKNLATGAESEISLAGPSQGA